MWCLKWCKPPLTYASAYTGYSLAPKKVHAKRGSFRAVPPERFRGRSQERSPRNSTGGFNVWALSTTSLLALSLRGLVAKATYILVEESPVRSLIVLSPSSLSAYADLAFGLVPLTKPNPKPNPKTSFL